jgi:hypothetical protein
MNPKQMFLKAVTNDYNINVVKLVEEKLKNYDDNLSLDDAEQILRECTVELKEINIENIRFNSPNRIEFSIV